MTKRIDLNAAKVRTGSGYPPPFDAPCLERARRQLGDAAGLTDFGVNLLRLPPGTWSSQRHWHTAEDEFVYVLEGELTLVTDAEAWETRSVAVREVVRSTYSTSRNSPAIPSRSAVATAKRCVP